MSNMKTTSLIAAEIEKVRNAERLDVEAILHTIDQENQILIRKINALEERIDLLEHQ